MRIGFIGQKGFPATWGGVEVHVDEVARRLAARGHHVTVFNRRWYAQPVAPAPAAERLTVVDIPSLNTASLDAITHSALSTCSALVRDLDIVHYQCMGPSLPAFLPRALGKIVIATIHGYDYRAAKWGAFARTALRVGERVALHVPHRTIVVARHQQDHYAGRGFDTVYVPNGVSPVEAREPEEIWRRWGLRRETYLLFIARLEPDKCAHLLVEAFRRWRAAHPSSSTRLVIAGPLLRGAYVSALRAGDLTNVVFAGEVSGDLKAELLTNALAVVAPSRFEGLPISLLEAMSAARPLLCSDIPGHREILPDGAGLFCETLNASSISAGIERLLALPATERLALGKRAAQQAAAYTWDATVTRLEHVYDRATQETPS